MPFADKEYAREWAKQYREKNKKRIKLYQQNYNDVNSEILAKKRKEYYNENKECIEEYKTLWRTENREKVLGYKRKYNHNNKEKVNQSAVEGNKYRRLVVLSYYSDNDLKCNCCEESNYDKLTIDHIKGRSSDHKLRHLTGHRLYSWLINNNFPDGYQVLCHSCNCSKKMKDCCNCNANHSRTPIL